ncbi:hypothetical protein BDY21DRAFT_378710 [Lineolata rhizophorae]|uniref:NADH dehydrogenase [ubiquinone] 1 alpha subcomplex assembly factor 3 n=1 Tax=Lineolata rhizophorae TaxID=578093 RepID=A0A6A6P4D7_9PEZI|nr:hypothetical protein BDY21DRAFT_378710 [Lineolata rhizophorae]
MSNTVAHQARASRIRPPNPPQRATTPKPTTVDRGPPSEEDTQTDFSALDVLSGAPPPATAIDACTDDGFVLNNGAALSRCGLLLVGGEAFRWWPWRAEWADNKAGGGGANEKRRARVRNEKGQWQVGDGAWGVLDLVWPKPDLLIIGTGKSISPLSPRTRDYINSLGIRIEVQDTQNAAAQFNMLATERGVQQIAAALVPIGFKDV